MFVVICSIWLYIVVSLKQLKVERQTILQFLILGTMILIPCLIRLYPFQVFKLTICFTSSRLICQDSKLGGAGSSGSLKLNFCREPKNVLVSYYTQHLLEAFEDAIGLPGKILNFEPCMPLHTFFSSRYPDRNKI